MTEFLASRSRRQTALRCARARYFLDEAFGHGWEPVKLAVPLLTGGSVHKGLATLLLQAQDGFLGIDDAVGHPVGSGLFQVKTQYAPAEAEGGE